MAHMAVVTATSLAAATAVFAETVTAQQVITPGQRRKAIAACGQDARLYCRSLREVDGPYAYLACLELNRPRLTARCIGLLAHYGQ